MRVERIGEATLYLGDCREVLPTLGKVDCVVTDPPYGIGFPYASYEDTPEALAQLVEATAATIIANAVRVVITPGLTNLWLYPKPDWIAAWTWATTATYGALGYNQWQPILFYGSDVPGFGSVNGVLKCDRVQVNGFATKDFTADCGVHTCPKPLAFVKALVERFSMDGETILDPFAGSGTTGVAAIKLGRTFIGIERDPDYFDIACRRIEAAYAQPDLFVKSPEPKPEQLSLLGAAE
jgi:DNA modification methylase